MSVADHWQCAHHPVTMLTTDNYCCITWQHPQQTRVTPLWLTTCYSQPFISSGTKTVSGPLPSCQSELCGHFVILYGWQVFMVSPGLHCEGGLLLATAELWVMRLMQCHYTTIRHYIKFSIFPALHIKLSFGWEPTIEENILGVSIFISIPKSL